MNYAHFRYHIFYPPVPQHALGIQRVQGRSTHLILASSPSAVTPVGECCNPRPVGECNNPRGRVPQPLWVSAATPVGECCNPRGRVLQPPWASATTPVGECHTPRGQVPQPPWVSATPPVGKCQYYNTHSPHMNAITSVFE